METPPQFPGAPKKSKTGVILGGIALAIVLCCCGCGGAFFYFGRGLVGNAFGMIGCSMAVDQQRDALLAYAEKHGGKLPPASGWQDSIKPYVVERRQSKEEMPFSVPSVSEDYCDKTAETSITYNSAIAGKKLADIKEPMGTVALFETPGRGRNKAAPFAEAPFAQSPKIVAGQGRGWIRQPLKGEVSVKDEKGRLEPIPQNGATRRAAGE